MKFKIEKAYDSVHLSEASKERILEELMDSQKPGFRTHQKAAPGPKWRAIPVALILIIVIAVGGFLGIKALGGRDMQSVATEPSDPTDHLYLKDDIIVTDTKEPFDYERFYADVPEYLRDHVIMYAQAFYEDWPREDWERFGLNLDLYQARDLVECGFVMKDLDGDGLEDLLIYGDSRLYEVLIVNSWPHEGNLDKPDYCLWSFPPDENGAWMSLCEDNVIMIREMLNERDIRISFNRFGKNEDGLAYLDTIETVYSIDGTEWFAGPNKEDAVPVTAEEADNILAGYKPEEVEPRPFPGIRVYVVNFQHQFDGVDARYLPLLMNYGKAMCEGWSQSRWVEAGLSLEVFYVQDEYWSLEYALVDLDGDGDDELLIFGDDQLYALYVLRNDQPDEQLTWKMHHNSERLSIQFCENNVVKVCQEDAAGAIDISFYQVGRDGVGDLSLVMVNNVLYTPDGQWYAGPNAKDAVAVTESEAQALVASYVPVEIEGIPMLNKVRIE